MVAPPAPFAGTFLLPLEPPATGAVMLSAVQTDNVTVVVTFDEGLLQLGEAGGDEAIQLRTPGDDWDSPTYIAPTGGPTLEITMAAPGVWDTIKIVSLPTIFTGQTGVLVPQQIAVVLA